MPDACDFIVDVQLKAADAFTFQRLAKSIIATLNDDCIGCGSPIPALRRAVLPMANRCVCCQGVYERKETRYVRA